MGVSNKLKVGDFVKPKREAFIRFEGFVAQQGWIGRVVHIKPPCVQFRGETLSFIPARWYLSCSDSEPIHESQVLTPDTNSVTIIFDDKDLVKVRKPKGWDE